VRFAVTSSVEKRAGVAFALVVLAGVAAGAAWYFFDSRAYTTYEIRTRESVSGLISDAPVEFHGVEVGKVTAVKLVDPHSVSILLSVKRDAPVTRATVATITARGLAARGFTGYVYVDLEDVGTDLGALTPPPGSRFARIPSAPTQSLNLDTTIGDVKQDVQLLTGLLHSVLDPKTVASLKTSIDNLQRVTQTLTANDERLEAIIRNTDRASRNAENAARRIGPLLESTDEAVRTLQGEVLPDADDTLSKLRELIGSLREITAEIERDPSIVIRGREPRPGPGERK
jgi:phospholipid/cholesterol/gamma-HCH transport system substrate-binding protein